MNTKNNRRSRDTVEALTRAFFAALSQKGEVSKVTVREICEAAGVNRSTFYAHYSDCFDLLERVERTMANKLTKAFFIKLEQGASIGECFEELFAFIEEHWEFYAVYLNETNKTGVIGLARELYSYRIPDDLWRKMGLSSPEEMGYHEDFAIAGLTAMIRRWLNTGRRETPHQLCQIFFRYHSSEKFGPFLWDRK